MVRKAARTGDWTEAKDMVNDLKAANSTLLPKGSFAEFSKYNIGIEKARMDAAGWMKAGPCRPPYHLVPDDYLTNARKAGLAWADLVRKYADTPAS